MCIGLVIKSDPCLSVVRNIKFGLSLHLLLYFLYTSGEGSGHSPASGVDQGFLERVFICIKVCGFALLILSNFS